MRYAEVAVDAPWTRNRTFSYSTPEDLQVRAGHSVWAPFGSRTVQGIVFEISPQPAVEETREIISVIDPVPLLGHAQLTLARWISQRYLAPLFDSAALMLPPGFRRKMLTTFSLRQETDLSSVSLAETQSKVLEYLRIKGPLEATTIKKALGARAVEAAEQLTRRGMLDRHWSWAKPSVGPKYVSVVGLSAPRAEAASQLEALKRRAQKQAELLQMLLSKGQPLSAQELRETGVSAAVVKGLEARGLVAIEKVRVRRDPLGHLKNEALPAPELTPDQNRAWQVISQELESGSPDKMSRAFLLHGVTGSGKTELYLRALERVVAGGRRGIVLVPEISLTPQTIQRFHARFPGKVAVLHSRLSPGEQFDEWWRIKEGEFDVVIGSRSALFAPQPELGLIVVDEEHDASYKQTDAAPRYHARDTALKLAMETGAVVILGSATPEVTSYHRVFQGELRLLGLPTRIIGEDGGPGSGASTSSAPRGVDGRLPDVEIVDMRTELKEGNRSIFSRSLSREIESALRAKEQTILFLNRRGAATFVQCRQCGLSLKCPRCDVALTYHSARERLICHHCGYRSSRPDSCPRCESRRISYLGTGTQRVEEEVAMRFPEARVMRWDRDVTGGKLSHAEILERFLGHEADILIGTQMIAKGLHMPLVTLVGVISADIGINLPDFRAGERAFQVLSQVAGRAGRGPLGGRVIIQTFNPRHYAIVSAAHHDYAGFYSQEIEYRRRHRYPPFSRIGRLVYSHTNVSRAQQEASRMVSRLRLEHDARGTPDTYILGPVPCYMQRLRGRYRWQVLVRSPDPAEFLSEASIPEGWVVDIDPVTLL